MYHPVTYRPPGLFAGCSSNASEVFASRRLGEVIGVSESTMQRKLAEKVKLQLDELNRIAHYLGKDTRYFLMEREITEDDLKKMQKKKEKG